MATPSKYANPRQTYSIVMVLVLAAALVLNMTGTISAVTFQWIVSLWLLVSVAIRLLFGSAYPPPPV